MARREQLETYCGTEDVEVVYDEDIGEEIIVFPEQASSGPNGAPEGSLWSRQKGVDFFLPPTLSLETLDYMEVGEGECATDALRRHFDLPAEQAEA